MKSKLPPDRRKFVDAREEMDYLYHKLLYWLYERQDQARAQAFAKRLGLLLSKVAPGHFDENDLLQEYLEEKRSQRVNASNATTQRI